MNWFRSLSRNKKIAVGAVGLLFTCGVIGQFAPKDTISREDSLETAVAELQQTGQVQIVLSPDAPTETSIPTETPQPTATENPNQVSQGTHLIGTDIQPGIYRGEAGLDILDSCYWARLSNLSGELSAIITNDNAFGRLYIEVKDTDIALEVGCDVELLTTLVPVQVFPETITAGTYLIGFDIQPGTYRGEAGTDITESCYWERLRDVTGELSSIIANDNASGQYFIQVSSTDFALSTGCELVRVGD